MNEEQMAAARKADQSREAFGRSLALAHLASGAVLRGAVRADRAQVEAAVDLADLQNRARKALTMGMVVEAAARIEDSLGEFERDGEGLVLRSRLVLLTFEELCEMLVDVWSDGSDAGEVFADV